MTTIVLGSLFVLLCLGCALVAGHTAIQIAKLAHTKREADALDELHAIVNTLRDDLEEVRGSVTTLQLGRRR